MPSLSKICPAENVPLCYDEVFNAFYEDYIDYKKIMRDIINNIEKLLNKLENDSSSSQYKKKFKS